MHTPPEPVILQGTPEERMAELSAARKAAEGIRQTLDRLYPSDGFMPRTLAHVAARTWSVAACLAGEIALLSLTEAEERAAAAGKPRATEEEIRRHLGRG